MPTTTEMRDQPTTVLLVARRGPLHDSLLALLRALPEIGRIHSLDKVELAPGVDTHLAPAIVMIDGDLVAPESYAAVRQLKNRWPETSLIVFGNDVDQQREAQKAGLGLVLLKGHPAPHLVTLIRSLTTIPHEEPGNHGRMRASQTAPLPGR